MKSPAPPWFPLPRGMRRAAVESVNSVLLETSRFDVVNDRSYLFLNPRGLITADRPDQIPAVFSKIEAALAEGQYVAGFMTYESGYHFESTLGAPPPGAGPIAWFGTYDTPRIFDHKTRILHGPELTRGEEAEQRPRTESAMPTDKGTSAEEPPLADEARLEIAAGDYIAKVLRIKDYIAQGRCYQVNLTDRISLQSKLSPSAMSEAWSRRQSVAYAAFINLGDRQIFSLSPELFFRIADRRIVTRPMKGTMARGVDAQEDEVMSRLLQADEKNRSELVMIVDLLRNDLGRICATGTIAVSDAFAIERYETLLQMTSTVSGTLQPGATYYDIFRALFPSGSITGAPKISSMNIIRELEVRPRGIYTGAIGFMSPTGDSTFNVAIRTLELTEHSLSMGVGGGIVADSEPMDEYRECLLKGSFLNCTRQPFELIETLLWQGSYRFLPLHLDRLGASAGHFNFVCDRQRIAAQLVKAAESFGSDAAYRVRLLLDASGRVDIVAQVLHAKVTGCRVCLAVERTASADWRLRHKTTQRQFYDEALRNARPDGFDDLIFVNERGEITEGAIHNVFIESAGELFTPPLTCGVLPGVFRRHVLETHPHARERVLTPIDLQTADRIFLCNAVHGLRRVEYLCVTAWQGV